MARLITLEASGRQASLFMNTKVIPSTGDELERNDKKVTGRTYASLYATTTIGDLSSRSQLYSEGNLLGFAMFGRGPGTPPPISEIITWESIKNTGYNPYSVQQSIGNNGTNPFYNKPELFNDALFNVMPSARSIVGKGARSDIADSMRHISKIYNVRRAS